MPDFVMSWQLLIWTKYHIFEREKNQDNMLLNCEARLVISKTCLPPPPLPCLPAVVWPILDGISKREEEWEKEEGEWFSMNKQADHVSAWWSNRSTVVEAPRPKQQLHRHHWKHSFYCLYCCCMANLISLAGWKASAFSPHHVWFRFSGLGLMSTHLVKGWAFYKQPTVNQLVK